MSEAKDEQESTETLSFRCDCERCRLMRGHSGFWQVRRVSEANPARPDEQKHKQNFYKYLT